MEYISEIFKTSPATYLKEIIIRRLSWMIILLGILFISILYLSFSDLRWVFIGLILLFIIIPIIVFNTYYFYLLTPEARRAISPKRVIFSEEGYIVIEYFNKNDNEEWEKSGHTEIIKETEIKKFLFHDKKIIVELVNGKPGFIVIPTIVLDRNAINYLYSKNDKLFD